MDHVIYPPPQLRGAGDESWLYTVAKMNQTMYVVMTQLTKDQIMLVNKNNNSNHKQQGLFSRLFYRNLRNISKI